MGFLVKNLLAVQETWILSLRWEDPLKGKATHLSILAWIIPTVDGVAKSGTELRDFHFHFSLWNINMTILQTLPPSVTSRAAQPTASLFFPSWLLPWWLRWSRICLQCRRHGFNPWVGKIPWREWQSTPVFLPGEFYGQRSLACSSPKGRKESDMTERLTPVHYLYFKIDWLIEIK